MSYWQRAFGLGHCPVMARWLPFLGLTRPPPPARVQSTLMTVAANGAGPTTHKRTCAIPVWQLVARFYVKSEMAAVVWLLRYLARSTPFHA